MSFLSSSYPVVSNFLPALCWASAAGMKPGRCQGFRSGWMKRVGFALQGERSPRGAAGLGPDRLCRCSQPTAAVTWSSGKVSGRALQPALWLSVPSLEITATSRTPSPSSLSGPGIPSLPSPSLAHILQRHSLFFLELFLLSSPRPLCPLLYCVLSDSKAISGSGDKVSTKKDGDLIWRKKNTIKG